MDAYLMLTRIRIPARKFRRRSRPLCKSHETWGYFPIDQPLMLMSAIQIILTLKDVSLDMS